MFKIGDKVKRLNSIHGHMNIGDIGTVVDVMRGVDSATVRAKDGHEENHDFNNLELIKDYMNIKEKFVQIFLKEPEKSFRKAGVTNDGGILTDEGQEIFLTWLLKQHGETFKTEVVDPILAEEKD